MQCIPFDYLSVPCLPRTIEGKDLNSQECHKHFKVGQIQGHNVNLMLSVCVCHNGL